MSQTAAAAGAAGEPMFADPRVSLERRADGSMIFRADAAPNEPPRSLGVWLEKWARAAPARPFLAERPAPGEAWASVGYGEAHARAKAIATFLLERGLSAERPVVVLSDNGVEHGLVALGCFLAGVPVAAISPAYSLMSSDHAKLKDMIRLLRPGLIFVADAVPFASALAAIAREHDATLVVGSRSGAVPGGAVTFASLEARTDEAAVARAFAAVGPDTIARFLFTSGSTGTPKAVINTHRMLASNQEAKAQTWPFVETEPPVILDWLPWSHTFGANHNFNLVLRNGGTLYVDGGKPAPHLLPITIANLKEIRPAIYFNVPRGYDMLVSAFRADRELRDAFFRNVRVIFYAGAALPQSVWEALTELAVEATGAPVPMVSSWGSTETAPMATDCHFQAERSGNIGVPVPGVELKLVPSGDKLEARVRGPNVTPGYWKAPDVTAAAFDEEGFYRIGDAVRFADPDRPERGIFFDGRVAEDFKLTTGTWVSVGALRIRGISALAPLAQDIVVTGHDHHEIGFLVFANMAAARAVSGLGADARDDEVLASPKVRAAVAEGLARLKGEGGGGSSSFAARALLMAEPAQVDAGEITDKGYVNQRAVLSRRAGLVERLQSDDNSAWIGCP